jgi:hypothetical protein
MRQRPNCVATREAPIVHHELRLRQPCLWPLPTSDGGHDHHGSGYVRFLPTSVESNQPLAQVADKFAQRLDEGTVGKYVLACDGGDFLVQLAVGRGLGQTGNGVRADGVHVDDVPSVVPH